MVVMEIVMTGRNTEVGGGWAALALLTLTLLAMLV
jgi:hypothetical protein